MSFRADLERLLADYLAAYGARDAAGCAAMYAEDAVIYSHLGPPLQGRATIASAHEDWFLENEQNKRLDVLDCDQAGDLGTCVLRYRADVIGADGNLREEAGTNLCILVRNASGWCIQRSSMNEETPV